MEGQSDSDVVSVAEDRKPLLGKALVAWLKLVQQGNALCFVTLVWFAVWFGGWIGSIRWLAMRWDCDIFRDLLECAYVLMRLRPSGKVADITENAYNELAALNEEQQGQVS